jgi:hypothetical protein
MLRLAWREPHPAGRRRFGHGYSPAEFGLDEDAIEQRIAPLFERYHWGEERSLAYGG